MRGGGADIDDPILTEAQPKNGLQLSGMPRPRNGLVIERADLPGQLSGERGEAAGRTKRFHLIERHREANGLHESERLQAFYFSVFDHLNRHRVVVDDLLCRPRNAKIEWRLRMQRYV